MRENAYNKVDLVVACVRLADEYRAEKGHYTSRQTCEMCSLVDENCRRCILGPIGLGCITMYTYPNFEQIEDGLAESVKITDTQYNKKSEIRAEFYTKLASHIAQTDEEYIYYNSKEWSALIEVAEELDAILAYENKIITKEG